MNRGFFDSISYRVFNYLVLVAGGSSLFLVGLFYVRPTLTLRDDTNQLLQAQAELHTAPARLQTLTEQTNVNAQRLEAYRLDTTRQEGYMLNHLSRTCARHQVTLAGWSRGAASTQAKYRVNLQLAKLRGAYPDLVQAIYELEYVQPLGRLASVRFALEEDRRQRRNYLYAYLYLQSITSEPDAQ